MENLLYQAKDQCEHDELSYEELMKKCIKDKVPVYAKHPETNELAKFIIKHYDKKTGAISGNFVDE